MVTCKKAHAKLNRYSARWKNIMGTIRPKEQTSVHCVYRNPI